MNGDNEGVFLRPGVGLIALTIVCTSTDCGKPTKLGDKGVSAKEARVSALEWTNASSPHALVFFTSNSCFADPPDDRLPECEKARFNVKLLTRVGELSIYDVNYYKIEDREPNEDDPPIGKSILAALPSGMYREIYFQDSSRHNDDVNERIWPTEVVTLKQGTVLRSRFDEGGIYGGFQEAFIYLSHRGVRFMNLQPIFDAAHKLVPHGSAGWEPTVAVNFQEGFFQVGTWETDVGPGPKVACCTGQVRVYFKLEDGNPVPIGGKYEHVEQF